MKNERGHTSQVENQQLGKRTSVRSASPQGGSAANRFLAKQCIETSEQAPTGREDAKDARSRYIFSRWSKTLDQRKKKLGLPPSPCRLKHGMGMPLVP